MDCKVKESVIDSVYSDALEIAQADFIEWKKLKNRSVLITGAKGFIGSYLVLALLIRNDLYADNIRINALVRERKSAEKKFGELLSRDDLTLCVQDVSEPIECGRADYVIHAASQASNIQFETDPVGTISANLTGTLRVLDFALRSESKSVLVISSLKVYGNVYGNKGYLTEADEGYLDFTSYKNCYAMGKRASETLAASYIKEYGLNVKLCRPAYIYGASSLNDDRVWAQFISNVVKNENILLKSNGAANRSFCYVTDTASAMLCVLLSGENGFPYNISNEKSDTTIREFAVTACEAFPERGITLSFQNPGDEREPEILNTPLSCEPEILDSSRLKKLGWQPKVDLKEGIKRAVNALEEQNR